MQYYRHLCVMYHMKNSLPFAALVAIALAFAGCEKETAADCQSSTYWANINLNGREHNTLTPCGELSISIDSTYQTVDTQDVNGYLFTMVGNKMSLAKGDSSIGSLEFNLFFFAKIEMTDGIDDSIYVTAENICAILDSNYHRLGNSIQDTTLVATNIVYTDRNGWQRESYYVASNWQVSGYGFQPLEIEGVADGECRTRFEMNALLSDSTQFDTVALYGSVRMPFR